MKMQVMTVTPEMAKAWLEQTNYENRAIRKWHVNSLANAIKRGEWKVTHQGIAFGTSGKLLDGQHRLEAIVEANKPVEMIVTFDVPDHAFIALDQGVNRSYADLLKIDKRISEPLRLACEICIGSHKVSPVQAQEIGEGGLVSALETLIGKAGATRKTFSSAPFRLAAGLRLMDASGLGEVEYVLTQYAALINCNIDDMSNASKAIMKQVTQHHVEGLKKKGRVLMVGVTKKGEAFARAMTVFDPQRSDVSTIRVTNESCRIAYETARKIIGKSVAKGQKKSAQRQLDPMRSNRPIDPMSRVPYFSQEISNP